MTVPDFIAHVFTPLATLVAVWVAYLAVSKGSEPQLLVFYQPNPDVPSLIDLVIQNIGGGSSYDVRLSTPIPVNCFGIDKPHGDVGSIPVSGFPFLAAGQRLVFNGGQYAGLSSQLKDGLALVLSYKYRNVIGFTRKATETYLLSISHLGSMPTRISAQQAIVDALKGGNTSTVREIRDQLRNISQHLGAISERLEPQADPTESQPQVPTRD